MPTAHIKKLEAIKEKRKTLQEEEDKLKQELIVETSNFLIETQAFDHIEYDIIMGGILDVIEKAKQEDKVTEEWKLAGQKFRQGQKKRSAQKNTGASKKIKKPEKDDE